VVGVLGIEVVCAMETPVEATSIEAVVKLRRKRFIMCFRWVIIAHHGSTWEVAVLPLFEEYQTDDVAASEARETASGHPAHEG
jgi:hypothetical protein